jgi:chitinase
LFDSGPQYPDTSVFQTHHVGGIPLHKLVIGKPLTPDGAANGYMEPEKLKRCMELAREKGWSGGVMYWEWDRTAQGALRAVVG